MLHTENMQLWGFAGTWKWLFEMHLSTLLLFREISDALPARTRTFCWSESPSGSISYTTSFMSAHFPAQTDERWAPLMRKSSLSGPPAAKSVRVRLIRSFDIVHLILTYVSWKFWLHKDFLERVSSFMGLASLFLFISILLMSSFVSVLIFLKSIHFCHGLPRLAGGWMKTNTSQKSFSCPSCSPTFTYLSFSSAHFLLFDSFSAFPHSFVPSAFSPHHNCSRSFSPSCSSMQLEVDFIFQILLLHGVFIEQNGWWA